MKTHHSEVWSPHSILQAPSSMALASLLSPKRSIKGYTLSLSFLFIPNASSSLFSSLCRGHPFSPPPQAPPVPKKVPFTVTAHGRTWQDPFHWMSNTNDPDLSEYLSQENSYSEAFMADTHFLQCTLFSEMKSRMPATISTPPERWGPWFVHFAPTHFVFLAKFYNFSFNFYVNFVCARLHTHTLRQTYIIGRLIDKFINYNL